jgi:pyridoxine 5-phosphate synthase
MSGATPVAVSGIDWGCMVRLFVNVDHVATLRQQRDSGQPDPVLAAGLCELAGADGITVHLREDRRHIQDRDVRVLRETVRGVLNLEMAAMPEMVAIAESMEPDFCTLVPEKRQERTTEGGLDVRGRRGELAAVVGRLRAAGMGVSLFLDPDPDVVRAGAELCPDAIELHTGDYSRAAQRTSADLRREFGRLEVAGRAVVDAGVRLAAGHGLDRGNVGLVSALPHLEELNIGHGLVAHAVMVGLPRAVRELRAAIDEGAARGARRG